jgi:hypothetical protein
MVRFLLFVNFEQKMTGHRRLTAWSRVLRCHWPTLHLCESLSGLHPALRCDVVIHSGLLVDHGVDPAENCPAHVFAQTCVGTSASDYIYRHIDRVTVYRLRCAPAQSSRQPKLWAENVEHT